MKFLGTVLVVAFLAAIFCILMGVAVPDSVVVGTLIGYLSGKAEQVISYYFGSSFSSQVKSEQILRLSKK